MISPERPDAGLRPERRNSTTVRERARRSQPPTPKLNHGPKTTPAQPATPDAGRRKPGSHGQGQRAPNEIMPSAASTAKASPNPAYRGLTSRSAFTLPTDEPMSLYTFFSWPADCAR